MTNETIKEVYKDTIIVFEKDSSMLQALLECDSLGNVLLKEIEQYEFGKNLSPPTFKLADNKIEIKTIKPALDISIPYKDVMRTKVVVTEHTKEVNILTRWQQIRIAFANIISILIPIYLFFKIRLWKR